jgi:hypothetical protein
MYCNLKTTAEANKKAILSPNTNIPYKYLPRKDQAREFREAPPSRVSHIDLVVVNLVLLGVVGIFRCNLLVVGNDWWKAGLERATKD